MAKTIVFCQKLAIFTIFNFWIFPRNDDFAGVEPEKLRYLGMGLTDFESKTRFRNADKFYIDHEYDIRTNYLPEMPRKWTEGEKKLTVASFKNTNIRKLLCTIIFLDTIWKLLSKFVQEIIKLHLKMSIFWRKLKKFRWSDLGRRLTSANSEFWLKNFSSIFLKFFMK